MEPGRFLPKDQAERTHESSPEGMARREARHRDFFEGLTIRPQWGVFRAHSLDADCGLAVYFLRHGQSVHNAHPVEEEAAMMHDPVLSELGKQQAKDSREFVGGMEGVDHVVVSSLSRAVETGLSVFEGSSGGFTATDLCREVMGGKPCNSRRERSILAECYPKVEFGDISQNDDIYNPWSMETPQQIADRTYRFLDWLEVFCRTRGYKRVGVVSHAGFLHRMTNSTLICKGDLQWTTQDWRNGEVRCLRIVREEGQRKGGADEE